MKFVVTFVLCALCAELSATVLPSVVERMQTDDYAARQNARVELMAAFAESTAQTFDSEARGVLEQELLVHVVSDAIPLEGRLYLLRMLEMYGTAASRSTLEQLTQDADPILSEGARRALRAIDGQTPLRASRESSSSPALERQSAYRSLLSADPDRALEVTRQMLDDPEAVGRIRIMTMAAHAERPALRGLVLPALLEGSEAEQLIAVVAIAEGQLTGYESSVLQILPSASGQLRSETVACLAAIGGDASFSVLYDLYEQQPKNQDVQAALARVRAPSADDQALRDAAESDEVQTQVAAVKLLALRNPEGATELVNALLQRQHLDPAVLKAAYQTLEQIGNFESVCLLLEPTLILGDSQRETQRSLKRLSLSLGIPDYLWSEAYQPALTANENADYRAAILEILDGVACKGSVDYLMSILQDPSSPDYALAYRSLQRWPQEKNLYAADMWLLIYNAETATEADRQNAEAALKKMLENKHPDFYSAQIDLLMQIGKSDLPIELKHNIFAVYAEPQEHFYDWYHPTAKRLLQPAVDIPDVAEVAQTMIDKL